jgi:hypothetical protein
MFQVLYTLIIISFHKLRPSFNEVIYGGEAIALPWNISDPLRIPLRNPYSRQHELNGQNSVLATAAPSSADRCIWQRSVTFVGLVTTSRHNKSLVNMPALVHGCIANHKRYILCRLSTDSHPNKLSPYIGGYGLLPIKFIVKLSSNKTSILFRECPSLRVCKQRAFFGYRILR